MTADAWRIVGGKPLHGRVSPSGSKNGALPTLAATLLFDGETVLYNVPRISDVHTMFELLRSLGLEVTARADGSVSVVNTGLTTHRPPTELVAKMRASHYVLGPTLARLGRVELPQTGGCTIGERPLGYILDGLALLGVECLECNDRVEATTAGLHGARVSLDPEFRSPGATFTLLMAAALAEGVTVIEHASFEPDVICFCDLLAAGGAKLAGAGTTTLTIAGVSALHGVTHRVNTDRLEAGTFLCAAAATRGDALVERIRCAELGEFAAKLREAGVEIGEEDGGVRARCADRPRGLEIVTAPFPHFPTDLQPPLAAVLATAEGTSTIHESIFDNRLQYAPELVKMGADLETRDARTAILRGVERLHGAEVSGGNIRDGAALVVAALGAEGESLVSGRRFVARGYERFEEKLRGLGAAISVTD